MKKIATICLVAMFIVPFLHVRSSEAYTSKCLKVLHTQAISDAISIMPSELKTMLKERETGMHEQVNTIHATIPNDRLTFGAYYKAIAEEMMTIDSKRLEYLSRMMTHITIYPFLTYSPLKMSDNCNEQKVLSSVTVLYDGFNSKGASAQFPESYKYESKQELIKLQQFYSIMVNEISDLWLSMWKEAGKDIAVMPQAGTLVRGKISKASTPESKVNEGKDSAKTFSDKDLNSYSSKKPEGETSNSWAECEQRAPSNLKNAQTGAGLDAYNDFMATCTRAERRGLSNSWAECEERAPGNLRNAQTRAGLDAYNDFMATCTGSRLPYMKIYVK